MKIFGHPHIPSPAFTKISNIEEIDKVLANSIPWWPCESDEDFSLAKFCQEQQVAYAVKIHDLIQLLLYTNLDAKYLIAPTMKMKSPHSHSKTSMEQSLNTISLNQKASNKIKHKGYALAIF